MTDATCAGVVECLWKFQTLVAGIFAIIAAVVTAYTIYKAARLPVRAEQDRHKENEGRRLRLRSLELSEEFSILGKRAIQGKATVKVHKAAKASITDETRRKMMLRIPPPTRDWEFMSLTPEAIVRQCIQLNGMIEDHNFDMERAGGAFGDDNFGRSITARLETISKIAADLSQTFSRFSSSFASPKFDPSAAIESHCEVRGAQLPMPQLQRSSGPSSQEPKTSAPGTPVTSSDR